MTSLFLVFCGSGLFAQNNIAISGRVLSLALTLLLPTFVCLSQEYMTIQGQVVDKDDKEPLSHATIGIKGRTVGTITNSLGEFRFNLSGEYLNDTLYVSMLGYRNYEAIVKTIDTQRSVRFELVMEPILLNELSITVALAGNEIIKKAIKNFGKNYPMEPFILEGFYRKLQTVNDTAVSLLEAAISIYDKDYRASKYHHKAHEKVAINEIRKSYDYIHENQPQLNYLNVLKDWLSHNEIRYRTGYLNPRKREFRRDSIVRYNNRMVYVISTPKLWKGKIYVDTETFAILKLEYQALFEGEFLKLREHKINDSIVSRINLVKSSIEFKELNNVLYLSHYKRRIRYHEMNTTTGKLKKVTVLDNELVINNTITENVQPLLNIMEESNLELQAGEYTYNPEFWKNYNIIKETPLDKKLIKDLEKDVSLQEQFKKAN